MKEEVLRLDRVTALEQGVTELNHFNLNVFAGEIMGLIPVNGIGLETLLRLLRQNLPLHYGYVYYREKLVNHWLHADHSYNRIAVIESRSGLADDLTVVDNVFVLRKGFRKWVVQRGLLNRLLEPFLREIDMDISADTRAADLTHLERFMVEIVKAVVAGCRLIILNDAGTIVSDVELTKLHSVLRHYAAEGISFLYISRHYEEVRAICDRAALMIHGQISKIVSTRDTAPDQIHCFSVESYERLVLSQSRRPGPDPAAPPALEVRNLFLGMIQGLNLAVGAGECVVLQDLENHMFDDLIAVLTGGVAAERGEIRVGGAPYPAKGSRDVAVVQRLAARTMLFPELSYMDNLCFTMDERLPRIWVSAQARSGVRREYEPWLGKAVFDQPVETLTLMQKYDLIYARVLLQRPKVALCVQPFMQADVEQRMHIWQLIEKLLEKRIAVVILAVNLADTLSLADRLVRIQNGKVLASYDRREFGSLPDDTPWQYLWNKEDA